MHVRSREMLKSSPETPDDRANIVWTGQNFTLCPGLIILVFKAVLEEKQDQLLTKSLIQ